MTDAFVVDYSTPDKLDTLLTTLEDLVKEDKQLCAQITWHLLTTVDATTIPAFGSWARELCVLLNESLGKNEMERRILSQWPQLDAKARVNLCYGVDDLGAISTELALALFESPSSTVGDRHRIVDSLAAKANMRGISHRILVLADRVGTYTDKHQQEMLEAFLGNLRNSFSCPPEKLI